MRNPSTAELRAGLRLLVNMALILFGCVPTMFQTPEVLKPGQVAIGGGVTAYLYVPAQLTAYGRRGMGPDMDLGLQVFGTPVDIIGLAGDMKLQILGAKWLLALDIGAFGGYQARMCILDEYYDPAIFTGVYPMILTGCREVYAGIGGILIHEREFSMGRTYGSTTFGLAAMLGGCFGERWRFVPQLHWPGFGCPYCSVGLQYVK